MIECELNLLKEALKSSKCEYFHLLSGQDLPLANIQQILDFFRKNRGKNFIHFDRPIKSLQ